MLALAAHSRFSSETFLVSIGRTAQGWERTLPVDPAPNSKAGDRSVVAVLPSNSPAPLLTTTVLAWLQDASLTIKPSREDHMFAREWIEFAGRYLKGLRVKIENDVDVAAFDRAIVYGSDETVAMFRTRFGRDDDFYGFGHRFSVAYVESADDIGAAADRAAADIVTWDQTGCLSPQTIFVRDRSHGAEEFARALAKSLCAFESRCPRKIPENATSLAIRALRADVAMREAGRVFASEKGTSWSVLYDPEPVLEATPLHRTVWVRGVRDQAELIGILEPHRAHLEIIGVEGLEKPLVGFESVSLGEMQSPPLPRFLAC